jgi:excisionase family DNA binding protein
MEKDFLSAPEVMDWLGISKPTLLAWLRTKDDPLPGVKVVGRWRFRREAILQWWERREVEGGRELVADVANPPVRRSKKAAALTILDKTDMVSDTAPTVSSEPKQKTASEPVVAPAPVNDELTSWLSVAKRILAEPGEKK